MITSYLGFMDNYGPNRKAGDGKRHFPPALSPKQQDELRKKREAKSTGRQGTLQTAAAGLRNRAGYSESPTPGTQSSLLDKHHYPMSLSRKFRGATSMLRQHSSDLKEEENEDDDNETATSPFAAYRRSTAADKGKGKEPEKYTDDDGAASSSKDPYDSDLGDSFMSTGIGGDKDTGEGSTDAVKPEAAGVLNLIYQFQKAHGENLGRGLD